MTPRIGEILVREGLVTEEDVQEGLSLTRQRPVRLASALVILGRVRIDDAARALARLHGVPAALEKHLSTRDVALAELIPAALARELVALPLAVRRGDGTLVVCARDPSPATAARISDVVGRPVVLAASPECAVAPLVNQTYGHPKERAPSEPGVPVEFDIDFDSGPAAFDPTALDIGTMQLVDLDDQGVSKDLSLSNPTIRLPGFAADAGLPRRKRVTTGPLAAVPTVDLPKTLGFDDALDGIRVAETRNEVLEAVLAYLRHTYRVGMLFDLKDAHVVPHAGFGSPGLQAAMSAIAIPLGEPSVFNTAFQQQAMFVGAPGEGCLEQDELFALFGKPPPELIVVPIITKERVVNLVYAHGQREGITDDAPGELGTLTESAQAAFGRLFRQQ